MPAPKAPAKTQPRPKQHPDREAQAAEVRERILELMSPETQDFLDRMREADARRPLPKRPKVKIVYHHQLSDADSQ